MITAERHPDELLRLASLKSLEILDTPIDEQYDAIVAEAANFCKAPIALISLVDENRQWFKAKFGLINRETPRDIAFCAHAILSPEPYIIPDAYMDERFHDNPLVIGEPHIRFYMGFPLLTSANQTIGTLCVIDTKPRHPTPIELIHMTALARQVVLQIEWDSYIQVSGRLRNRIANQEFLIQEQKRQISFSSKMAEMGEMSGTIIHELNNPLSIILGRTQILLSRCEDGTADLELAKNTAKTIEGMVHRMLKIISSFKSMARDDWSDNFEEIPISKLVTETIELCKARFYDADIKLNVQLPEEDLKIYCRSVSISQVLVNLLNNAFDAVGPLKEQWVTLEVTRDENSKSVVFSVTDSGNGIDSKVKDRLMKRFFTTKKSGSGTGIGLYLSKQIIENHGGTLYLDETSKHTRFSFNISDRSERVAA